MASKAIAIWLGDSGAEEFSEHACKADDGVGWYACTRREGTNPVICSEDVATSVDQKYFVLGCHGAYIKESSGLSPVGRLIL